MTLNNHRMISSDLYEKNAKWQLWWSAWWGRFETGLKLCKARKSPSSMKSKEKPGWGLQKTIEIGPQRSGVRSSSLMSPAGCNVWTETWSVSHPLWNLWGSEMNWGASASLELGTWIKTRRRLSWKKTCFLWLWLSTFTRTTIIRF